MSVWILAGILGYGLLADFESILGRNYASLYASEYSAVYPILLFSMIIRDYFFGVFALLFLASV